MPDADRLEAEVPGDDTAEPPRLPRRKRFTGALSVSLVDRR
ncbi:MULTISPECIES: hypothetical protein [Halorussus]|nr:hypothetical protein [Halorussus vallis]